MPIGFSQSRRPIGVRRATVVAALAAAALVGTAAPPATAAPGGSAKASLATELAGRVKVDKVYRHLQALQRIADQHGGTRAIGTPGYDASFDHIAGKVRAAGFDVTTPAFQYVLETVTVATTTVGGAIVEASRLQYSANSAVGGSTGPLAIVPVDDTTGCEPADYAGATYTGTVAVIRRGGCTFAQKQATAGAAGAVAAIIVNNVGGPLNGTLGDPAAGVIPTVGVAPEVGAALVAGTPATVNLQATMTPKTGRSIVAQTRTGRGDNVVMLGSHLDSVPEGPGINDNGSGSAALLETALQLGGSPDVENAVRFAWWGAEELGLVGSEAYVAGLTFEQQVDIALYLNFDMIASPNAGYFVYDGDDSDGTGAGPGPVGSGQLEKTLVDYLVGTEKVFTGGTDFDGRSDYGPFIAAGIPSSGVFTGAEAPKGDLAAALWGGTAGVAYDKCYHQACDNLQNINRLALERNSHAIAYATGLYATSTEDVNGVPPRDARAEAMAFSAFSIESADAPPYHGHLARS
jgi:Zn-dependent M28 family amino/carboxypeptidase